MTKSSGGGLPPPVVRLCSSNQIKEVRKILRSEVLRQVWRMWRNWGKREVIGMLPLLYTKISIKAHVSVVSWVKAWGGEADSLVKAADSLVVTANSLVLTADSLIVAAHQRAAHRLYIGSYHYGKCYFPLSPYVRLSVGRSDGQLVRRIDIISLKGFFIIYRYL